VTHHDASGSRPRAEPSHIPYESVHGTEEDHGAGHDPEGRRPGAVLTNGQGEQQQTGEDAEGRDQGTDSVGHTDIINHSPGQQG
jgi:hypothetical protein